MPGKTAGKLEVYDTSSGVAVGPWDIAAGRITFHRGGILNFYGAQESIPRNRFRQPMQHGGPVRQLCPTRFLAPRDCSKISAQFNIEPVIPGL